MKRHSMVTRKDKQKGIEGENQPEEMDEIEEMIRELVEEDPRLNQPENPTQTEPEVEVMVGDQPSKPTQKEDMSTQEMFRIMMEQFGQMNKKLESVQEQRRQDKEELFEKLDSVHSIFKPLNEPQDTTSEGNKEIEF